MRHGRIALIALAVSLASCAKNKIEHAQGKTFVLYPAVEGKAGDKNCQDFYGSCLLFQTAAPVLQLRDFEFKAVPKSASNKHNQIEIALNEKQSLDFEALSGKYSGEGKMLAIVYEHRILHAPKLRGRIKASAVTIDFCNAQLYKILLAVLRGQMPPNYDFSTDSATRVCFDRPQD